MYVKCKLYTSNTYACLFHTYLFQDLGLRFLFLFLFLAKLIMWMVSSSLTTLNDLGHLNFHL